MTTIEITTDERILIMNALNYAIAHERNKSPAFSEPEPYEELLVKIASSKCGDPGCSYCGDGSNSHHYWEDE